MNAKFLQGQEMESYYFHVRDRNSQQKSLTTNQKLRQIAVISLTTIKPMTARKQPQPPKKVQGDTTYFFG